MATELYLSKGTHIVESNLKFLGNYIESPSEVLDLVLKNKFRLGGYMELGELDFFGEGLVIKKSYCDIVIPTSFNEFISIYKNSIEKKEFSELGLVSLFNRLSGPIMVKRDGTYKSIFELNPSRIRIEDRYVMEATKEFLEVYLKKNIDLKNLEDLEFIISLSKNK